MKSQCCFTGIYKSFRLLVKIQSLVSKFPLYDVPVTFAKPADRRLVACSTFRLESSRSTVALQANQEVVPRLCMISSLGALLFLHLSLGIVFLALPRTPRHPQLHLGFYHLEHSVTRQLLGAFLQCIQNLHRTSAQPL